jgi:hypothetical protein
MRPLAMEKHAGSCRLFVNFKSATHSENIIANDGNDIFVCAPAPGGRVQILIDLSALVHRNFHNPHGSKIRIRMFCDLKLCCCIAFQNLFSDEEFKTAFLCCRQLV